MKNKALSSLMVVMLLLSGCLGLDGAEQQTPDPPLDPATEPNPLNDTALTLEPEPIPGCTRPGALNFDATANLLDDSCVFRVSLNDVLTSIGSVIDSAISFSSDEGIGAPFEISNEKMQISASSMGNGSVFVTMRHLQSGLTNVLYDLHDSHIWCTNAPDTSSFDQSCYSGNNLPAGVDPITSWMASQLGNIWGDAPLSSTLIEFQKITDLLHTLSSVTDLEWTEALGATVQKQVFLASTNTSPPIGIEVSVNPTTARVSSAVVSFNDSTYMFSQYSEYDGSAVPDSQRLAMQIEWHGEIGRAKSLDHCVFGSHQFENENWLMYASDGYSTQGPFMIEFGDPISSPDEIYTPDCSLATGELLDEESLGDSLFVSWHIYDDDEPAGYTLFYLADNGRAYHDSDESRSDCDGGEDDFTQGRTWDTTYSTCWYYSYDWSFVENYTQTEYDWHTYQHCEWDAEWEDWVCTDDDDHSDHEFHEYWFYCEHDQDRDIWFCTDDLGQSPDHEFTDGNEIRNQGQIVLGDYFCTLPEHWDDHCFPLEGGDYEVVDSGFGKVVMGLETTTVLTVLCMDGSQLNHDQIGDMVADCLESVVRGISVPSDEPYAFVCGDGSLILQGFVNDGWEDCTDGSDEGVESHPDRTPELPAIYWDCWAEDGGLIQLMKSETRPSEESYDEAIQSTEIPDWCGQELSPYWKHYLDRELEPSQSTMENLSGPYWFFHEEYSGAEPILFLLNADGTSEQGSSHYSEEECEDYEEYGLYWSEEYDICMGEAEDWSADEQMMQFFYGEYRFDIQDSVLRIVPPAHEDEYSGGPEEQPVLVWGCYNEYNGQNEVYIEDNSGVPSEQRIDAAQLEPTPSWCGTEVEDDLNSSFSSDASSESSVVGDYWYLDSWDGEAEIYAISFSSDMQIRQKKAESSLDECSEYGGTYDPVTQVCTISLGYTWSANQTLIRAEFEEDGWSEQFFVRYEMAQNGSEVYFWNAFETHQYPDGYGFEEDDMQNTFYDGYYEVGYHEYQFTAEVDGEHVISSTTDVDGHLYLYFSPFDPEDPLSNIIVGQHYWYTHSHGSRIEWDLVAGVEYVIVTTPRYSDEEMQFQNEITDPSDTQWSWAGAIDDSTPRYTRPDGHWVDPPIGGPTFNCHDSMATVPLNRTLDGFADCHDASDEGWSLPMVASGMVASSDMGSLADLEIRLFLGSGSSLQFDDSLVTTDHYTNGTATAVAYHWSEGLTCFCEFVFMDADGDGAVSSGDWWTFWIWEGSSGWTPDDQLLLIDHVFFFDLVAEEHV